MKQTGSELIVQIMKKYGINKLFGNPGTTEMPLVNQVSETESIDYILSLHEDIAVGAAGGYSQRMRDYWHQGDVDSPLSMVNLHSTPGLMHGTGNLYNISFDGVPVIITTGSQDSVHEQNNPLLSGERENSVKDMVKWSATLNKAEDIPKVFRRAARKALTQPMGPVFVDIPYDVQKQQTDKEPIPLGQIPQRSKCTPRIDGVINEIENSNEITIFVGDQVSREGPESVELAVKLAEELGSPVYGEVLLSESSFPAYHEQWIGTLGPNEDYNEASNYPETIIALGCSTNAPLLGEDIKEGSSTLIEISHDPESLNQNVESDYSLLGHIGRTCVTIANQVDYTDDKKQKQIERAKSERKERLETLKQVSDSSVSENSDLPTRLETAQSLNEAFEPHCMFVDEGVTTGIISRSILEYGFGQFAGVKGGGLGQGLPLATGFAIAEQEINSDRTIVNLLGDGAFQYYPQTLYTISRHVNQPMTIIVADNNGYEILRQDDEEELTFSEEIDIQSIANGYGIQTLSHNLNENLSQFLNNNITSDSIELLHVPIQ